ncbi:MAG: class I SAM-dependent methyltransferase [Clostridia bacterium]|nr:class I SAM-dependent methyltransferase [Clostridia bacterium]
MNSEQYKTLSVKEFTRAADIYDGDHSGIYERCREDYPPIAAELEHIPFENLLDVGCGTGPMVYLLSESYPTRHFTGVDLTPKMIEKAKEKQIPNATFVVGDSEKLPEQFGEAAFDCVICANSFHHYPNPQAFFDGVAKVLRPSGYLVMRDYTSHPVLVWLMNHVEMPIVNLTGHGDVRIYSVGEVRSMCEKAGLTVQKIEGQRKHRLHLVAQKKIEAI